MNARKLAVLLAMLAGLGISGLARAEAVLTLLSQNWTAGDDTGASSGSGSFNGGAYNGSVVGGVSATKVCTSVWVFWCPLSASSQATRQSWDLWFGLAGMPGDKANLGLSWNLDNVIGLSSTALGLTYVGAGVNFDWTLWDGGTGIGAPGPGIARQDGKAIDGIDGYVDTRTISGVGDLGLLEVGDLLHLTGSFRDEAYAKVFLLGTLSAVSFAIFDFQVTATPVPEPVPEPGSLLLAGTALAALAARRKTPCGRPAAR